jgi:hypothetical protein
MVILSSNTNVYNTCLRIGCVTVLGVVEMGSGW